MLRASNRKLQPESKFSAGTESKSDINKFYFVQAADTQLGNWIKTDEALECLCLLCEYLKSSKWLVN